jgi:hypothetical protein
MKDCPHFISVTSNRARWGGFLLAVDEGRIPSGSVLIVEGLDRLSRAEPIRAQAQLAQIINAGITVVTASDGREYNREKLKAQPMDLVYSLLVMIRAHEESDTKSKRVKAAIRRQCEGWLATADLRLSVLLDATSATGNGSVSATTFTGGVVHGSTRAELDPAHAQRIIGITDACDQGLIALRACQSYINEIFMKADR